MEIHELKTLEDEVNRRGSKIWTRMNDNSRANLNRENFIKENGGFFVKHGRYWKWNSPIIEKNGYWLKRVDTGEKVFFENMTEFGKQHGLTPVKICELLNGKRKTYKGWTADKLREIKETTGGFIKEKKKENIKVVTYNGATFQNMQTKEVFYIENIAEYAKKNNISKSSLYKVARGKAKSYKGLKLYNPLEA
jgi:predicted transcriptional regulator